MGGSSPNSDFKFFGGNFVFFSDFCVVFMFTIVSKKKNWIGGSEGGV